MHQTTFVKLIMFTVFKASQMLHLSALGTFVNLYWPFSPYGVCIVVMEMSQLSSHDLNMAHQSCDDSMRFVGSVQESKHQFKIRVQSAVV